MICLEGRRGRKKKKEVAQDSSRLQYRLLKNFSSTSIIVPTMSRKNPTIEPLILPIKTL